ncbi:DUF4124 domain-containing protein [Thiocystis violacea]|uniref:DUF4124 domain-containing protein n=1 Tax=Thiocystis violacea TaxID=13725 RepID=UPI0019054113|nr:DUF4124 domain-containing protein [Thiocystis violacea]MBK1725097.1 hypothetical protein [Thiocystis violacea]
MSDRSCWCRLSVVALALHLSVAGAEPLYRWTDDQGEVHYSDRVPNRPHRSVDVETPSRADQGVSQTTENPYSVMNQTRVMEAERLQREQARRLADMERVERQRQLLELEAARVQAHEDARRASTWPDFVQPIPRPPRPDPPRPAQPPEPPAQPPARPPVRPSLRPRPQPPARPPAQPKVPAQGPPQRPGHPLDQVR